MKRNKYLERVQELYDSGAVDAEVYDAMLMNVDVFCNNDDGIEDVGGGRLFNCDNGSGGIKCR